LFLTVCLRAVVCIAVAGQQELQGQLVCFKYCGILKRDFAVLLSAQQQQHDQQQVDVLEKQHQQEHGDSRCNPNSSTYKVSSPGALHPNRDAVCTRDTARAGVQQRVHALFCMRPYKSSLSIPGRAS
jgi:hypothetical protein